MANHNNVIQDELYNAQDLMEQIFALEGIRAHIVLEERRYLERRYQDVYVLPAQGTPQLRAEEVKRRVLHLVHHYSSHSAKLKPQGKNIQMSANIQIPKEASVEKELQTS